MPLDVIFIVAGFMLLIKGADYVIDGSSAIARRFGISTLVIGLTVVAFGTSAPELAINILSATAGKTVNVVRATQKTGAIIGFLIVWVC